MAKTIYRFLSKENPTEDNLLSMSLILGEYFCNIRAMTELSIRTNSDEKKEKVNVEKYLPYSIIKREKDIL